LDDFAGAAGADNEQNIGRVFQRTTEQDEAFLRKTVHESGVGSPIG
jgi:hypothetical protein